MALSRSMLLNNLKHGREFKYFDIQKQGKDWFAWFVFDYQTMEAEKFVSSKDNGDEV